MSKAPYETAVPTDWMDSISEADRHRVLAVDRRRIVFRILRHRTLPLDLEQLATAVATRELETDTPSETAVERVSISLHHCHLPLLTANSLVEYDVDTQRVSVNKNYSSH